MCALVTGVQTCALPICGNPVNGDGIHPELQAALFDPMLEGVDPFGNVLFDPVPLIGLLIGVEGTLLDSLNLSAVTSGTFLNQFLSDLAPGEIGRASCREIVCQYV